MHPPSNRHRIHSVEKEANATKKSKSWAGILFILLISLAVIAAALIYGLFFGKYEIFPYKNIENIYKEIRVRNIIPDLRITLDPPAFYGMIETNLLRFKKVLSNSVNPGLALAGVFVKFLAGKSISTARANFLSIKKVGTLAL